MNQRPNEEHVSSEEYVVVENVENVNPLTPNANKVFDYNEHKQMQKGKPPAGPSSKLVKGKYRTSSEVVKSPNHHASADQIQTIIGMNEEAKLAMEYARV